MIWRIAAEVSWIETAEVDPVRLRNSFRFAPIAAIHSARRSSRKRTFVQVVAPTSALDPERSIDGEVLTYVMRGGSRGQ